MSNKIFYRMLGYVVTIVLHGGNMAVISMPAPKEVQDDIRVQAFKSMRNRYLTVWTFSLQFAYAVLGLLCDCLILLNSRKKDYRLPKYLHGFRETLFVSIVFPSSIVVFSMFWAIYLYDRGLVYPEFLDKVLSPISNHIMHTFILPIALWEIYFNPRKQPKSHMRYVGHMIFHFLLYLFVLFYTYFEHGRFIYPIASNLFGSIYFYMLVIGTGLIALFGYSLQWILYYLLSAPEKPRKKLR
ncbi:hypothetical protein ACJJTC_005737 [Scirpophaga incertulas]